MPTLQIKFCLSSKTNLCQAIRSTGGREVMPDGSNRLSKEWPYIHH